jgi:hypothetical protein
VQFQPGLSKIMQAMAEREESRQLDGFVQIDAACLGGERTGESPAAVRRTSHRS